MTHLDKGLFGPWHSLTKGLGLLTHGFQLMASLDKRPVSTFDDMSWIMLEKPFWASCERETRLSVTRIVRRKVVLGKDSHAPHFPPPARPMPSFLLMPCPQAHKTLRLLVLPWFAVSTKSTFAIGLVSNWFNQLSCTSWFCTMPIFAWRHPVPWFAVFLSGDSYDLVRRGVSCAALLLGSSPQQPGAPTNNLFPSFCLLAWACTHNHNYWGPFQPLSLS